MVQLTPVAITKVKEILTQQTPSPTGLRVAVVGGGAAGGEASGVAGDPRSRTSPARMEPAGQWSP